ncbi:hypothetical protein DEO72_LG6g1590 [Vigna unguiculata]|uniref:Uncharacterized protein n=1 Tax=Vigna unguiculata TaxID=3917 RepID=A0A4D6M673_VIGUN|nr:hypothetical protein DEO72_LG6g1589 [Vigna unguiculata]QCD96880.1 hypothetical protein DEO72_LG6g1590 [Vigna unguiculata]
MNLPVHGTTSPDPSPHSCVQTTHISQTRSTIALRSLSAARRNLCRPPDGTASSPGSIQTHYFKVYRLVEHTLLSGATQCRDTPCWSYRLADTRKSRGAIPVALFF